jgi:hypothetical protein
MTHLHPVNEAGNGANAADAAPRSRPSDRAAARLAASRFDRLSQEAFRALDFAAFLTALEAPTPAQQWLERAAAELERQRDPDGDKKKRRDRAVIEVMERDGSDCWFCAKPLNGDVTLEHLQPLALGGTWKLDNLALAHKRCNKAAGHLPRFKKEVLREEMQSTPREAGVSNKVTASNS